MVLLAAFHVEVQVHGFPPVLAILPHEGSHGLRWTMGVRWGVQWRVGATVLALVCLKAVRWQEQRPNLGALFNQLASLAVDHRRTVRREKLTRKRIRDGGKNHSTHADEREPRRVQCRACHCPC